MVAGRRRRRGPPVLGAAFVSTRFAEAAGHHARNSGADGRRSKRLLCRVGAIIIVFDGWRHRRSCSAAPIRIEDTGRVTYSGRSLQAVAGADGDDKARKLAGASPGRSKYRRLLGRRSSFEGDAGGVCDDFRCFGARLLPT